MIDVQIAAEGVSATAVDFTVANNATWSIAFRWKQGDAPVSIDGQSLRMQLRANPADLSGAVAFEFSSANSHILPTDESAGEWLLSLSAAESSKIDAGTYAYDVLASVDSDSRVYRRQQGLVVVEQGVTRG